MTAGGPLLTVPGAIHRSIWAHLLPAQSRAETAAFMFVRPSPDDTRTFDYLEWYPVPSGGFESRSDYHLELTDNTRAYVIKRAHDLEASLVELHRHGGPWPAAFSPSDHMGFRDFVPHVWWRLRGRPYFAIVVTSNGFDGLAWLDDPNTPCRVDGMIVDDGVLLPTGQSTLE